MSKSNRAKTSIRGVLAENLRRIRKSKGLSQEALADLAALHRTFVGSVERSERNVSIDNVERLAKALSVSVAELLIEVADKGRK